MSIKILFLTPYPHNVAPSQRFRFEQYFEVLSKKGYLVAVKSFFSENGWQSLYIGSVITLVFFTLLGLLRRIIHLFESASFDYVFIHREVAPIGPPIFEWLLAKVFRKKIIYDFDDAIWLEDPDEKGSLLSKVKWKSKVANICKWSYKVSVGNEYLADFARKCNDNVVINPTTIDTEGLHNPSSYMSLRERNERSNFLDDKKIASPDNDRNHYDSIKVVIGWTGTHSTLQYLDPIIPVLEQLEKTYDFEFVVIANKNPEYSLRSFVFLPWNKETEIEDLMKIDIGVMPLTDDPWSRGKCGFKLLQYMALGIPAIASPVGANAKIITNNLNGTICDSPDKWYDSLALLIQNPSKRRKLGEKGREKVINNYSVLSNQVNFLSLFE